MVEVTGCMQTIAEKHLSITRETELLHSFVRINVNDNDAAIEEDEADEETRKQLQQKKIEGNISFNKVLGDEC